MDRVRDQVERSRRAAWFYRARGWNPLPSRRFKKAPLISFSEHWTTPLPVAAYRRREWAGFNVQVMTGAHWKLCVVDLDGPEAADHWPTLGTHEPTWESSRGEGSRHVWFALPAGLPSLPSKAHLWGIVDGEDERGNPIWRKHVAIELLADRKLVMAPPSLHPDRNTRYSWLPGHGPREIPRPSEAPGWLLAMPDLDVTLRPPPPPSPPRPEWTPCASPGGSCDIHDVRSAITNPVALAASWGLRIDGSRAGADAVRCHAFDRPDENPSALLNVKTGVYWNPWVNGGRGISLFQLAVELGAYPDFPSAVNGIGATLGVTPSNP